MNRTERIWSNPILYIVSGSILLLAFVLTCALWKQDVEAEVIGRTWERQIMVEILDQDHHTEWCDDLPRGAQILTTTRDIRSHRTVKVGQECKDVASDCPPVREEDCILVDNGDGAGSKKCPKLDCTKPHKECSDITREEPVYDSKCTFSLNRWKEVRWAKLNNNDFPEPVWPSIANTCGEGERVGCEREGRRDEIYRVEFRDDNGKLFSCNLAQNQWATFTVGSKWQTRSGVMSGSHDCSTMRRLES